MDHEEEQDQQQPQERNHLFPRRRTENLTGDADDWVQLLKDRKMGGKKSTAPPKLSAAAHDAGINALAQLVASKPKLDIFRNKKMANPNSANAYIKYRNEHRSLFEDDEKTKRKKAKDGTDKKSGFEGWEASNEFDVDGDDIRDNIVFQGRTLEGRPKNLKYVEGYNVSGRNQGLYNILQSYLTTNDTAAKRKATPYSSYKSALRKDEGVKSFMDLWHEVFENYLKVPTTYGGSQLLNNVSKMIQNRVRMYLYKRFMVELCREYQVVDPGTSTDDILEALKRISNSSKVRDTIMNWVYSSANGGNLTHLESRLFPIINIKIAPLIRALIAEYRNGKPIDPDAVGKLLYTKDAGEDPDKAEDLIAALKQ
jgi:hypothetical protein